MPNPTPLQCVIFNSVTLCQCAVKVPLAIKEAKVTDISHIQLVEDRQIHVLIDTYCMSGVSHCFIAKGCSLYFVKFVQLMCCVKQNWSQLCYYMLL